MHNIIPFFAHRAPKSAPPAATGQPALDERSALRTHYFMDLASIYPAMLLGALPGMTVLVGGSSNNFRR